jgi:alginate O-acetyltransferase complex protein AlgI
MIFDSWTFLAFAMVVYPTYALLGRGPMGWRRQNTLLLIASYVFYGAWDPRFLSLIALSTAIDYVAARGISASRSSRGRNAWLGLSCASNLAILFAFKYFDFFVGSAVAGIRALGFEANAPVLAVILPVGISFYTFQSMSYAIDVHRGRIAPIRSLPDFALYVAFFPQLVAGPIERAERLLPQLTGPRRVTRDHVRGGLWLVLVGLFKKSVLADNLGRVVDLAFDGSPAGDVAGSTCLFAVYAFALQIYCDFSGYSDMARGLARLLGIELMRNFDRPYLARDPREFWQRWHISLSTWLRDYVYIPLGGSRGRRFATARNLMLTMLLGGLWHGAAWTFVLWGAFHGLWLALHRYWTGLGLSLGGEGPVAIWTQRVLTFHAVCLGWLLFRARDLTQVGAFLHAIARDFVLDENTAVVAFTALFAWLLLLAFESVSRDDDDPTRIVGWRRANGPLLVGTLVLLVVALAPAGERPFLYFQF